ncbi:hypothetical protein [uncultured Reyranella sp.]|jgi:hypothetical protein|uniref:hypothetical protein n=1 Tax=uncultured Reyranella sp. TaxID=735512 RepID=UPI00259CE061|nr:hypothetical protein [uncultured Reyranella sp.]
MTVVGLIAINLTPLLYQIAYPQDSADDLIPYDFINSSLVTGSALVACFLAGMTACHPPWLHQSTLDKIWMIVVSISLSFWLSGLIFGIAFAFTSKIPSSLLEWFGNYLAKPFFFSIVSGTAGPLLFGPVAYIAGIVMLWPLHWLATPQQTSSDWDTASTARRLLTTFCAALSTLSVFLAAASFLYLSCLLVFAGVASLKGKI